MVKAPKGYYTILDFMTMNEFERNVALSEFRNMINQAPGIAMEFAEDPVGVTKKAKRKKSQYSKALSKEMKAIRKKATLKSGKLRKGMTPAKILKQAHKNVKRRLK